MPVCRQLLVLSSIGSHEYHLMCFRAPLYQFQRYIDLKEVYFAKENTEDYGIGE